MDELIEFLRARLDEREEAAKAATPGPWVVGRTAREDGQWDYGTHVAAMGTEKRMLLEMNSGYFPSRHVATAEHITANDPKWALRDVEAKRRILDEIVPLLAGMDRDLWQEFGTVPREPDAHLPLLKLLAFPDSNHPDYQQEWKP